MVYAADGRYTKAIDYFEKVLTESEACNKAAEAAIANEDYAVAEKLLVRAINKSPRYYPEAEENLEDLRTISSSLE